MATHSILPGKSHRRRSLVGCSPWVARSRTRLSDFTFTFHFHALEKAMTTHSSVLAWRIPGTGSLVGCRLWGRTESDTTAATQQQEQQHEILNQLKCLQFFFQNQFSLDLTCLSTNCLSTFSPSQPCFLSIKISSFPYSCSTQPVLFLCLPSFMKMDNIQLAFRVKFQSDHLH